MRTPPTQHMECRPEISGAGGSNHQAVGTFYFGRYENICYTFICSGHPLTRFKGKEFPRYAIKSLVISAFSLFDKIIMMLSFCLDREIEGEREKPTERE